MPWLRRLVVGLLQWKVVFRPRLIVRTVMDKVALGTGSSPSSSDFPLSLPFPLCTTFLFILILSQQKDKRAKPENLIKQCSLEHGGTHQTSEMRPSLIRDVTQRTPCTDVSRKFLGPMRPKASNTPRAEV